MVDAPDAGLQRVVWGVAGLVHAISDTLAARALFELQKVANDTSKSLYDRNHAV